LAKVDKSQYTKEEWREIREQRRREKALNKLVKLDQELGLYDIPYSDNPLVKDKNYILCLKHGTKYSFDYVNKLYNMVKRNCTIDFEFVCLTDDPRDINPEIKILPLPGGIAGWWCKPYIFSKDLPLKGTVLYMDLDIVIANNIDKLFTYQPNQWCTIRDFTRVMRPSWKKYNSSVIRYKTGQLNYVWEEFDKDKIAIQKRLHGDQDWLHECTFKRNQAALYPDSWILSWKWEVRTSREYAPGGMRGNRKLKVIERVTPRPECCVAVFHGDPSPHNCLDPWVVDNWQ